MHTGTQEKKSKTEVMYCPPHRKDVILPEHEAPVKVDNEGGIVTFTDTFKYLGSRIHRSLQDDADVDGRIKSATCAFGALKKSIFGSKHIKPATKKAVYLAIILNILLYGAESWCLTEKLLQRLRVFHNQCIRSMCRVTRWHTRKHRISNKVLRDRLKMETIDQYISERKLRWAGHVARMDHSRLPRKFLTSWVRHPRPVGRPQYTFGHSLNKTLERAGIPTVSKTWRELAQDRANWRKLTQNKIT